MKAGEIRKGDLHTCPHSPAHRVYGGYPEYVCSECATEWVVTKYRGRLHVLYTHFNSSGKVVRRWRVPIEKGEIKKRSLLAV